MKSKRDLIRSISVNKANFDYIVNSGESINGSLLLDIERIMEEHKDQYTKPLVESLEETVNFCQQWAQTPDEIKMLTKAKEALKIAKQ